MSKYPKLLSPFTIGDLTLRNRVVMAPMTRARGGKTYKANDMVKEYYAQRASAGLIITEGTHVSSRACGWPEVPGIYTKEQTESWKPVVDSVHKAGGHIFMQLWHQGRDSHSSFHDGKPPVSASALAKKEKVHTPDNEKVDCEVPHALTVEEIKETVEDYRRAAENAKAAGFDGVEVHSANGYLIDQFLQSKTNVRTDEYGGSIENRYRFLDEVVDAVLTVWPKERVGVRLSPNGAFGEMGSADFREQFTYAAEQLGKKEIGFLHVMDGLGFGFHKLGEPMTLADFRKLLSDKTALIGNVGYTAETAEERIASGDADLIAFGRLYLSNPDLVERFENDWPLEEFPPHNTWFSPDETYATGQGYADFPTYKEKPSEAR